MRVGLFALLLVISAGSVGLFVIWSDGTRDAAPVATASVSGGPSDESVEHAQPMLIVNAADGTEIGKVPATASQPGRPGTAPAAGTRHENSAWFIDWVIKEARVLASSDPASDRRISTTLEPGLQQVAEDMINLWLLNSEVGAEAEAALVAMRPDGAVIAMASDGASQSGRSPRGTEFQTVSEPLVDLVIYLAALRSGMSGQDLVRGRNNRATTLADAFEGHDQRATKELAQRVGRQRIEQAAADLGIDVSRADTWAANIGRFPVTLLELTAAYASLRSPDGFVKPWTIQRQDDGEGGAPSRSIRTAGVQDGLGQDRIELIALVERSADERLHELSETDVFVAARGGGTGDGKDQWFVGFTESMAVGVWVGSADGGPMPDLRKSDLASMIWQSFLISAGDLAEPAMGGPFVPLGEIAISEIVEEAGLDFTSSDAELTEGHATAWCDMQACDRAYRSFRASDCTYQPYNGPRQRCTRGDSEPNRAAELEIRQASPPWCNVRVCDAEYRSFRAADCTYQPYSGGRRVCDR